ncbi:hypothetical protein [Amycolatopsis sp. NBC_01480]|nr:hypothetical protein [Amycolatopsis sp. NBC_01480]
MSNEEELHAQLFVRDRRSEEKLEHVAAGLGIAIVPLSTSE